MASKEAIHHDEGKRPLVAPQGSIELNQPLDPNQRAFSNNPSFNQTKKH